MILIDTREKEQAIRQIIEHFDKNGVDYDRTKLYVGDYQELTNPQLVIDRKHNIDELARNCSYSKDYKRFLAELDRAARANIKIIFLVEQNKFKDRDRTVHVKSIEDLIMWQSKHWSIRGEQVFRNLSHLVFKYDIEVRFCNKRDTGKKILEILT